jgi:uncharacterized membrane protein YccC
MEVLEKLYWLFLDTLLYVILYIIFILIIVGVIFKFMIDRIFYALFGVIDNVWDFLNTPKIKHKKIKKGEKHDR